MKYKYPKKILIGSTEFKITYDYKSDHGAEFSYQRNGKGAFIKFGMKEHKTNPLLFFMMLIHELKELIQIEQYVRYNKPSEYSTYIFMYDHGQHDDLCCRLAGLLSKFIKQVIKNG